MLNKTPEETPKTAQPITLHIPSVTPVFTVTMLFTMFILWLVRIPASAESDAVLMRMGLSGNGVLGLLQYYRLMTSQFLLEGAYPPARWWGVVHGILSLYTLYIVGIPTEKLWGNTRTALVFILGGMTGVMVTLLLVPFGLLSASAEMTTASYSILALLSAEMVYLYKHRRLYRVHAQKRQIYLSGLLVVNLIVIAFAPHVDLFGVLGALAGGVLLAAFISPYMLPRRHPDHEQGLLAEDINPLGRRTLFLILYIMGLIGVLVAAILL